ncbi:serine hydrolase [Altericroceibacterium endophyticum]|uniref:Beta-lactamase n=1 Tax=Altericroceibacterium endophyticum TaxID=1808508 RepID=A0A6I4T2I9_9SPHN|nr:serine hydrolase [Altericroceibacterium endophyticum]MXO65444.1 serine hydrolase [Altericroceibacterium endophyticum]
MKHSIIKRIVASLTLAFVATGPAHAEERAFLTSFDHALGTEVRTPQDYTPDFKTDFERTVANLAAGDKGRIGVAALDLSSGKEIAILGDQRFPMASTSKIAIAATFLEGVDQGRWSLTSEYPLMVPQRSQPFSSATAPVHKGSYLPASQLLNLMLTRSSNSATDALLAVVGGPDAVNAWAKRAGIGEFELTRDIATLVRDDGEFDPAAHIDHRDSATPRAMVQLLTGLYQGRWLSSESRNLLINTMEECRTGKRRIVADMPSSVTVAHKTGSLHNTSSDIGLLTTPDGRTIAVAIYVTGQGSRLNRERRIASIARAVYDGYTSKPASYWVNAKY